MLHACMVILVKNIILVLMIILVIMFILNIMVNLGHRVYLPRSSWFNILVFVVNLGPHGYPVDLGHNGYRDHHGYHV